VGYNHAFFMLVARRFVVRGRVQGVGFRYFTQDTARREGVTGWVRNLPDGAVEVLVEGEAEAVARVERAVRSGPPGARVDTVFVDSGDASGAYVTFSVTT
jgi:acylphosphatase